jgi:uncharacterized protein (DUF1800 family)
MVKHRAFVLFGLACTLVSPSPASFSQSRNPSPPAVQHDELLDPIVKGTTAALDLRPEQEAEFRNLLHKHSAKLTDLKNHLRDHPYVPKLLADLDTEQKAIKDELSPLLDDGQKERLASFNLQALPAPPGIILISLPARSDVEGPIAEGAAIAAPQSRPRPIRLTDDQKILQLLNRITYGPRPGDIQAVKKLGIDGYLDQQLHPETIDDSAVERRLDVLPTLHFTSAELYDYYPDGNVALKRAGEKNAPPVYGRPRQVSVELMQQKLVRAVESKRQLQEVMTDFWFNHFNVFIDKQPGPYLLTGYERDVIRPNALGKFRDLLLAIAKSPAMLFYLDNWLSQGPDSSRPHQPSAQTSAPKPKSPQAAIAPVPQAVADKMGRPESGTSDHAGLPKTSDADKSAQTPAKAKPAKPAAPKQGINENYARELMELHTLGVDGGYTQKDVQEVARCFTGWTLDHGNQGDATFVFRPWMHDNGSKTVLGVQIAAAGGYSDGLRVIDILAHHPSTARFISKELCQRFVSDNPPEQLVDRIARVFLKTDGDIGEVLRAILTSPEFNSPAAFRSKIKAPLELAASALRALDGDTDGTPPIESWISRAGEPLYRYQFPTGFGEDSSRWVNSGVFINRLNFMVELANNRIKGTHYDPARFSPDVAKDAGATKESGYVGMDAGALVDRLSASIIHTTLSTESRRALMVAMSEGAAGHDNANTARPAATDSHPGRQTRPASTAGPAKAPGLVPVRYDRNAGVRVSQIIELLLGTAEFQRR